MKRALESNLGLTPQQTDYLVGELLKSFGSALVQGYEELIPLMRNPEEDRHVLAAAVHANAAIIVTFNLRHFPSHVLRPYGIAAHTPDDFLVGIWESDPELMARILNQQASGLAGWTVWQVMDRLSRDVPRFIHFVRQAGLIAEP